MRQSCARASSRSVASETEPARLLAVFVVDTSETVLTIPFGGVTVDCYPPNASPECGTFDQSVLIKTPYPYPHWIPVVGTLVGALVFWLAAWILAKRRHVRAVGARTAS